MINQELAAFLAVAETGSFSAAAERLGRVQSNVTARIRTLEARLGTRLFDRGRHGAVPTAAGTALLQRARPAAELLAEGERAVRDQAAGRTVLRLGSMETTAAVRLPSVLSAVRRIAPELLLQITTGTTDELIRAVAERRLDAAFVADGTDLAGLEASPAFAETLVLALPAGAPGRLPLLAFRQGCAYRSLAERWLRASGRAPVDIMEFGTLDGILGCVAAGLGMAILPEAAVKASVHRDVLRVEPLGEPHATSSTKLVSRSDAPADTRTIEVLLQALARMDDVARGVRRAVA